MNTVKTESYVKSYEIEGVTGWQKDTIKITTHWNRDDFVVIHVLDGPAITVSADDLLLAVKRARG